MDALVEEETLSSFIVDLPPGGHALVFLDALGMDRAVERCRRIAAGTRERVVLSGGPRSEIDFARASRREFAALAADAQRKGASGALVLVDASDAAAAVSEEGHVGAEGIVGREGVDGVRIVCVYTRELVTSLDEDMLLRAAMAHSIALTPRAGRIA